HLLGDSGKFRIVIGRDLPVDEHSLGTGHAVDLIAGGHGHVDRKHVLTIGCLAPVFDVSGRRNAAQQSDGRVAVEKNFFDVGLEVVGVGAVADFGRADVFQEVQPAQTGFHAVLAEVSLNVHDEGPLGQFFPGGGGVEDFCLVHVVERGAKNFVQGQERTSHSAAGAKKLAPFHAELLCVDRSVIENQLLDLAFDWSLSDWSCLLVRDHLARDRDAAVKQIIPPEFIHPHVVASLAEFTPAGYTAGTMNVTRRRLFRTAVASASGFLLKGSAQISPHNGVSREVAEFIVNTRYDDLPKDVLDLGKKSILDALGLALSGSVAETGPQSRAYVKSLGLSRHDATIIGSSM